MSRVQLALNVSDLDAAVDFYSRLFAHRAGQAPSRLRQLRRRRAAAEAGAVREPGTPTAGSTTSASRSSRPTRSAAAQRRLTDEGLDTDRGDEVTCCYAVQDKVWVDDPDGAPWEIYTVLDDAPNMNCPPAAPLLT